MKRKKLLSRIFRIISLILCILGGIFYLFFSYGDSPMPVGRGIFGGTTIIGAIIGLKFNKVGNIICLIIGVISLISSYLFGFANLWAYVFTFSGSIIGLIGYFTGRYEPSRKTMKAEETKKEERDKLELEKNIYNYLKDNENRAFTTNAIMNQIFSDSHAEVSKEMVKQSLENLVKQGEIQRTQKDTETFYLY